MKRMTNEELQEIFRLLEQDGWEPKLCDTPIPYIDSGVQAGLPTDQGDFTRGEMVLLPEVLIKDNPTFVIGVKGESMKDADILPGDRLQVVAGTTVKDGDIVIASIDGENTLKAFYTDEGGNKWLVPYNDAFCAILLTEEMKVNIVGKVISVIKDYPRLPYRELQSKVQAERNKLAPQRKKITPEQVEQVIREMGGEVKQLRQWYAVFRAMVDLEVLTELLQTPRLIALVKGLKEQERKILYARVFGDLSFQELGQMFHKTPRQMEMTYYYILRKLRKGLEGSKDEF